MTGWFAALGISIASWCPCWDVRDEDEIEPLNPVAEVCQDEDPIEGSDSDFEDDIPFAYTVPNKNCRRKGDSYYGVWYEHRQRIVDGVQQVVVE